MRGTAFFGEDNAKDSRGGGGRSGPSGRRRGHHKRAGAADLWRRLLPAAGAVWRLLLGWSSLLLVLRRLARSGLVLVRLSLASRLRLGRPLGLERLDRSRRGLVGLGPRPRL